MISMRSSARSALKLRDNRVKREQNPRHGHYNGLSKSSFQVAASLKAWSFLCAPTLTELSNHDKKLPSDKLTPSPLSELRPSPCLASTLWRLLSLASFETREHDLSKLAGC
jgi:hypothetical protein